VAADLGCAKDTSVFQSFFLPRMLIGELFAPSVTEITYFSALLKYWMKTKI